MNYMLDIKLANSNNASNKARRDIRLILKDYSLLLICDTSQKFILKFFSLLIGFLKLLRIKKNDTVFFQMFSNKYVLHFVRLAHKLKKFTLITLIHDIETLRYSRDNVKFTENYELVFLDKSNYIISHNEKMTKWLKQYITNTRIYNLQLFDYLCPYFEPTQPLTEVCFAGNLNKSKFIDCFNPKNFTISYFGNGIPNNLNSNSFYRGEFNPNNLLSHLDGKYGLVWDGDSIDSCMGNYGLYTLYNNPHKLSMYLAAGIPIICWKQSAISEFVNKHNIGFCIDSLTQLEYILPSVSEEMYNLFKKSALDISRKVRCGYYLKSTLSMITKDMLK